MADIILFVVLDVELHFASPAFFNLNSLMLHEFTVSTEIKVKKKE